MALVMQKTGSHIIVVEDEPDIMGLLSYSLTREGYAVSGCTDGEQALKVIPLEKPHLVLLDLMLPGVGGLEICRLLKANPETARIPIIMVSARSTNSDMVTGLELGADDYIAKPFSLKVLLARVHAALRRRALELTTTSETPKTPDTVINLLRQVEGGVLSKIFEIK